MKKEKIPPEKISRVRKVRQILLNVLLIIILAVGVFVAFSMLPIKGNYKLFTVMSGSMEPKISVGSVVVVKPISTYSVGDIITFQGTGTADKTTHRIYRISDSGGRKIYTTKGDANDGPDGTPTYENQIIGKEYASAPLLGYLFNYIKTPVGLVLIIIIPAVIIVYEEIKKIVAETKNVIKNRRQKRKKTKGDKNS